MKKKQKIRKILITIAFLLFPAIYYYFSPYLIVESAGMGIINGSFIVFSLLFISSLLLGRGFCGWVCPAGGAQETAHNLNSRRVVRGNIIKWLIWLPWLSVIVLSVIGAGGYSKVNFFYQTKYGLSIDNVYSLITYMFVLALIMAPAFIIGRRSFCHHICWMSPFMVLGRKLRNIFKWPSLRLFAHREKCINCHTCIENCPMSLPVEAMVRDNKMENSECILCGTCIDGCKQGTIEYKF